MSKKGKIVLAAILVVSAALVIWSQAPRSLSYAMDLDPSQTESVDVYLFGLSDGGSYQMTLSPKDPVFIQLWDLLDSKKYVPMATVNVPKAIPLQPLSSHGTNLDYDVSLLFLRKDQRQPPAHINMDGWDGIYLDRWYYRTSDSLAFQQSVLDLLLEQEMEYVRD